MSIYLPVAREPKPEVREPNLLIRGGEKVLVVDDDGSQREMASRVLVSLGYSVLAVADGVSAIKALDEFHADVVLLDMILGDGWDGLETYRHISERWPQMRCIIVSGFSQTEDVSIALKLGACSYICKPYTREVIGRAIRQAVSPAGPAAT